MDRFLGWAQKEYSFRSRIIATAVAGSFFVFVIPSLFLLLSGLVDAWLDIPRVHYYLINYVIGALIIVTGLGFAVWSVIAQVLQVRGTPLPMMPTRALLVSGPFKYCRNPMSFGTLLYYLGIAIWIGSFSAIAIIVLCALMLVFYIKRVEEHELERRFGQEYIRYRHTTPFLFPGITLKDGKDDIP